MYHEIKFIPENKSKIIPIAIGQKPLNLLSLH